MQMKFSVRRTCMGTASRRLAAAWLLGFGWSCAPVVHGATLKAEYRFNGSLASSVAGAPDLISIDPLAANQFNSDLVNGLTQPVFTWSGLATPVNEQAGLMLTTTGLVSSTNYSVEMVFKLTDRVGQWRRLIDVSNRQSDNGFYVDTANHLAVYPILSSLTMFTNNAYADVVLTVANGTVSASLDGVLQLTGTSTLMNLADTLIFFVDNDTGGGQGEFSNGSIALLRLYDGGPGDQNPPVLTIQSPVPDSVVLSWAAPATGYVLQQNSSLNSTNWTASPLAVGDDGTNKTAVVNPPVGTMFYRLYRP